MQLVYSEAHWVVIPFHLEKFCTFSLELLANDIGENAS